MDRCESFCQKSFLSAVEAVLESNQFITDEFVDFVELFALWELSVR